MAKSKKTGTKRGPYNTRAKKAAKKSARITNTGRKEVDKILKNYSFDPDSAKDKKWRPYDVVLLMDNPTDESKHAKLTLSLASFFRKDDERHYSKVAFGYDAERFKNGGRGTADIVAIFDSQAHENQNAPIMQSGKMVNSRRHINTIMKVLRLKLPSRGTVKEIFLTLEKIDGDVYRLSELKDYSRELSPVQTGE